MTAQVIQDQFVQFTGLDGLPLSAGYVYFGQANQDPRQYPTTVYFDGAMTVVAPRPLRTTGGYLMRNGSPTNVYVPSGSPVSVLVLDSLLQQVYYVASWQGEVDAAATAATAAAAAYVSQAQAIAITASNSAAAAADSASAATISAAAAANSVPGALITALIGTETSAIAVSAEEASNSAMKVVDAANPLNNQTHDVLTILGASVFPQPKMVIDSDMRTLKWSPHNMAKQSDSPGSNISGATATTGQVDSDGTTKACKLTATSGTFAAFHQISVSGSGYTNHWHTQEWIVQAGTAAFFYLAFNDGTYHHVWFNASTWAVATADAGVLNGAVYTTRSNGTVLPAGYRRLVASFLMTVGGMNMTCGMADADGSKNVTVGRTMTAEKPFLHLGVRPMDYFENTGTSTKVGIPIDYAVGGARILIEPSVTYNSLYPNDFTNAAWVKTNITAALTTTGPDGETCSTLTATASNGTALQTTASAVIRQVYHAFVRRRTGSGVISMTTDNGGTYTDVTSRLNSTTYTRIALAGVANPVIGFKISTSGDAIDVAYAQVATSGVLSSPRPALGSTVSRTTDAFIVPTTLLTSGSAYSVYADFDRMPGGPYYEDTNSIRIGNSAFTQEVAPTVDQATGGMSMTAKDGTTTKTYPVWTLTASERLEITAKVESGQHLMSINGEPPAWITTVNMPTVTQVKLAHSAPLCLRRLLIVNSAVNRDQVHTWRYSGAVRNRVLASAVAAWDRDPAVANATMNREPSLCVLSDDGETADVLVFWQQRHDTGHHVEAPARLMQRKFRFDKTAGTITALSNAAVIQQQAGWTAGTGHLQSPKCFRIPSGANAGRLVMLFTGLENVSFVPDMRSIYCMTNDADGDPTQWSAATKIVSAGSGAYFIVDPSGAAVILPETHPVAPGRLVATYTVSGGSMRPMYSDNDGTTWTLGTLFSPAITIDETNLSIWPDGTLIATSRVTIAALTRRTWAKSTDGGATFVDQGVLPSYTYSECSAGIEQLDPTGVSPAYGKIALSHPSGTGASRSGLQIDYADDSAMNFTDPILVGAAARYYGYSSIKSLFGGSHIALAAEGGSVAFNTDNTVYLWLVESR